MSLISVGGEVDLANADLLAAFIAGNCRPGDELVFDLAGLSFMDCSGVNVLVRCARQAAGVRLAEARGGPARLLEALRMHVHDTVEQALAARPTSWRRS
ncbi:STAS domain-containing protein [Nonomuraea sp. NPDC050790]|uniref:STAS domain-containing protein n=1 Tax=Nonomuraea sp. NPDC050790 TaxID=3364371 RepID=UPI0037B9414D